MLSALLLEILAKTDFRPQITLLFSHTNFFLSFCNSLIFKFKDASLCGERLFLCGCFLVQLPFKHKILRHFTIVLVTCFNNESICINFFNGYENNSVPLQRQNVGLPF